MYGIGMLAMYGLKLDKGVQLQQELLGHNLEDVHPACGVLRSEAGGWRSVPG